MGFTYLNNQNWIDISREERLFCAHLYEHIRRDIKKFVEHLFKKAVIPNDEIEERWEIGYEVCFFRDFLKSKGMPIKASSYSDKRTFDLCLFSENRIIIIEAKVHEIFEKDQIDGLNNDVEQLREIIELQNININTVVLASSIYFNNFIDKHKNEESNFLDNIDCRISWNEMSDLYKDDLFDRADNIYGT